MDQPLNHAPRYQPGGVVLEPAVDELRPEHLAPDAGRERKPVVVNASSQLGSVSVTRDQAPADARRLTTEEESGLESIPFPGTAPSSAKDTRGAGSYLRGRAVKHGPPVCALTRPTR